MKIFQRIIKGLLNQIFGKMDYEWALEVLNVNILGMLMGSEAFLPNVSASTQKKIIAMTSTGGSITEVEIPIAPIYRASKAGLNMLMKSYALSLKRKGVIIGIVAPGTVDAEDYMNAEDPDSVPCNQAVPLRPERVNLVIGCDIPKDFAALTKLPCVPIAAR